MSDITVEGAVFSAIHEHFFQKEMCVVFLPSSKEYTVKNRVYI